MKSTAAPVLLAVLAGFGCSTDAAVVLRERHVRSEDRDCNVAMRVLRTNRVVVQRRYCGYAAGDTVVPW